MYEVKLTDEGDVELDQSGHSTFLYGADAAKLLVMSALSMWKSEWFLDLSAGVDWRAIQIKGTSTTQIIQYITSALSKNPRISRVIDISISFLNDVDKSRRQASLNYIVLIDNQKIVGDITL